MSKLPNKFYYLAIKKHNGIWYIHGLWPNYGNDSYPSYCKSVTYHNISSIRLLNYMEHYWYSPNKKPDVYLWKHEYIKHGSCMFTDDINEEDYFSIAIELFHTLVDRKLLNKLPQDLQDYKFPFDTNFNLIL